MDILKIGADIVKSQLGLDIDTQSVVNVLARLIGNGEELDIGSLVSMMQSGGLSNIASSWLGDGGNESISTSQILDVLGGESVSTAANELGTEKESLLSALSEAIPAMVDASSSGGALLDAVGGVGGALGMVNKLF